MLSLRSLVLGLSLGAALASVPPLAAGPGVTVDATAAIAIGEQREISSNLFGITAFEGFPAVVADRDYRARVEALRPGCFRFGGVLSWCAPPQYDPAWYDTPEADREFTQCLLFGARYPYGRFLPIVREMGAEPMCSLGSPPAYLTHPGTDNPSDFDRWAAYCTAYLGLWRKHDPQLRLVQIWNEPNATWFKDPRADDRGTTAADLHVSMAKKVARAVKARFPDMRIGGPVLCWPPAWPPAQPGLPPWYTWQMWTLPWLRGTAGTVDFFDFHAYDVSPEDFVVQTEMLYNQALLTQGRRLPIWITESSTMLAAGELDDRKAVWNRRVLPYERFLLRGVLPQADKVAGNLYHDLHARAFSLLPRGADDPDPPYWLLWVLRDLRGRRIVADSANPDVVAFATLEEDRVTVVLFNDGPAKHVSLAVTMPAGWWTGPETRAIGEGPGGACERIQPTVSLERRGNQALGNVALPARATASISFRLHGFAEPPQTRALREYFGNRTLLFLKHSLRASLTIRLPAAAEGAARLRVGLLGPDGKEPVAARLNDRDVPLKATALQEIPLEPAALQEVNRLEVWLERPVDNPRLALGFASIVTEVTR